MAITTRHPISNNVLWFLKEIGIDAEGVHRLEITFDCAEIVTVVIHKFMTEDDTKPLGDMIKRTIPVIKEQYKLVKK